MPNETGFYDDNPDFEQFFQGDVLRDIPFPKWPTFYPAALQAKWAILRPLRSGKLPLSVEMNRLPNDYTARAQRDVPDAFSSIDQTEYIVGTCQRRNVMILTRSCSLDSGKKHLVIVPVTELRTLSPEELTDTKLADLRDGRVKHYFHLSEAKGMSESYVDLLRVTSIHRTFSDKANMRGQLVARLSAFGTSCLQAHLSRHFGIQFGFDKDDECIQDAVYSCSACFHSGRDVTKREFKAGTIFGPCPVCGDDAAYVKLP